MSDAPVVISGAGPVGLALALGLARRGVRSIILEKKPALSEHSKAVVVLPRTCEILREWGLLDRFKTDGEWIERLGVHDSISGRRMLGLDFTVISDLTPCAGACVLPQNETERLLYEACLESALVDVRFGHEVLAFDMDEECVRTRVDLGDRQYVLQSSFLCGCDGAHSTVRQGLGFELEGKTFPARAVLADVRVTDARDGLPFPRVNFRRRGIRAAIRFGEHRWRLILAEPGSPPEEPPSEEELRGWVNELIGPGDFETVWASRFKIHCRNAPHCRFGRVLLLGDAAHLNSPAGGQGMNGGIQDAHNLAWKLPLALAGAPDDVLQSYDEERYDAIVHGVDKATNRLTRFGIFMHPFWRRLALRVVKVFSRSRRMQFRMIRSLGMLGHRYDLSPFIARTGGRLLPNIPLPEAKRLRDELGPDGGLLEISNGIAINGRETMEIGPRVLRLLRKVSMGRYVAVRPDGFIAYSGKSRAHAEAWLAKISLTAEEVAAIDDAIPAS